MNQPANNPSYASITRKEDGRLSKIRVSRPTALQESPTIDDYTISQYTAMGKREAPEEGLKSIMELFAYYLAQNPGEARKVKIALLSGY